MIHPALVVYLARVLIAFVDALRRGDLAALTTLPLWVARVAGLALGIVVGGALLRFGFSG